MNKEEFEKALAEVAEKLDLYLEQQVDVQVQSADDGGTQ